MLRGVLAAAAAQESTWSLKNKLPQQALPNFMSDQTPSNKGNAVAAQSPATGPLCPLCRSDGTTLAFLAHGQEIYRCPGCAHRFHIPSVSPEQHVSSVYGDAYFDGGGAGYENYTAEKEVLTRAGERYGKLAAKYCSPGSCVDVGAAAGFLLEGMQSAGWHGVGVEPNPRMADLGRQRGLDMYTGSFEEFCWDRPQTVDLVSMVQVAAHFVDPVSSLRVATELLKHNGLLLIETWDRNSWTARGFGKRWHEYSPPSVLHWFTRKSLRELAEGLKLRRVAEGRPAKRIQLGHGLSLLRHKMGGSVFGRMVTAPLAWVPQDWVVPYPLDDVFWALFQKQG